MRRIRRQMRFLLRDWHRRLKWIMTWSVTDAIAAAKRAISRILCLRCLRAGWEKSHFAWYNRIRVVSQIYCSENDDASWANIARKIPLVKSTILFLLRECVKFLRFNGRWLLNIFTFDRRNVCYFYGQKIFLDSCWTFVPKCGKLGKEHDEKVGSFVSLWSIVSFVRRRMQLAFYDRVVWKMHLQARFRRHLSLSHESRHLSTCLWSWRLQHDEESWWSALKRVRQHRSWYSVVIKNFFFFHETCRMFRKNS